MNTLEINHVLRCNKQTSKIFKGVFALDQLPKTIKKQTFLIVNTDKAKDPGIHWLAIYIPKQGCIEYFDSFGRKPDKLEILSYLKNQCIVFNEKQLQNNYSDVCGQYCCVYSWYRCCGYSMKAFLKKFSKGNHIENDKLILNIFQKLFGKYNSLQVCVPKNV